MANQREHTSDDSETTLDMQAEFAEQTLDTFVEFGEPLKWMLQILLQLRPKPTFDDPLLDVSLDEFDFDEGFEDQMRKQSTKGQICWTLY